MPAAMLPSASSWVDEVACDLLTGHRFLVRGYPRAGKSWLATKLVEALGDTAVHVRGREFTEDTQHQRRQKLSAQLHELTASKQAAQLVFDDYHVALNRTAGLTLQRQLVSDLIDSPDSRDIGAIFFARLSPAVHLRAHGSPLVSRLDPLSLPSWGKADRDALGLREQVHTLRRRIGWNVGALALFAQGGYSAVVDRLSADAASVVDDLSADVRMALTSGAGPETLSENDRRAVSDFIIVDGDSPRWVDLVADAHLSKQIQRTPAWPKTPAEGAREFAKLVDGWSAALWCDRFLVAHPFECARFVRELRQLTGCHLRILTSNSVNGEMVRYDDLRETTRVPGVELRIMKPSQRVAMHDRHLAQCGADSGWVLPPCEVLFGLQEAGSAVATSAPGGFGLDYDKEWPLAMEARFTS